MIDINQNIESDLYQILDDIKNCDNKVQFQSLKELFERLQIAIDNNNLDIKLPSDYYLLLNKFDTSDLYMKNITAFINNYKKHFDFDIKLSKLYRSLSKYYKDYYSYPNYETNLKLYENIIIVRNFLKEYDYEINSFFEDMILSGHIYTFFGKKNYTDGYAVEGNKKIKPYIFINLTNSINDLLTFLHEIIHAYISQKRIDNLEKEINKININNFDETYSMFIELVLLDYLKNKDILRNDVNLYERDFNNNMIEDLNIYYRYLKKKNLFSKDDDINVFIESQSYAQGRVLAYHFYNQFLNDKKYAKNNILNFMIKSHIHDKKYMINHYGLSEKEILNSKNIIKNLKM